MGAETEATHTFLEKERQGLVVAVVVSHDRAAQNCTSHVCRIAVLHACARVLTVEPTALADFLLRKLRARLK